MLFLFAFAWFCLFFYRIKKKKKREVEKNSVFVLFVILNKSLDNAEAEYFFQIRNVFF